MDSFSSKGLVSLDIQATNKEGIISEMAQMLVASGRLNATDKAQFVSDIMAREAEGSTDIGDGVAVPHAISSVVKGASIVVGVCRKGVDYRNLGDTEDSDPVHLLCMIALNPSTGAEHLTLLSKIATAVMGDDHEGTTLLERITRCKTESEAATIMNSILEGDGTAPMSSSGGSSSKITPDGSDKKLILAVTACPTGIAHTYMARDALIKAGTRLGVEVRVETNGATGVQNPLTAEDIRCADAIIIAADKAVDMARFDGKHVLQRSVSAGVKHAEELVRIAIAQNSEEGCEVYSHSHKAVGSSMAQSHGNNTSGRMQRKMNIYKHLMSGVSHMLPFVIGGGILIAMSFMFGINASSPDDPTYNVVAAMLMTIGGAAFFFLVPILAAYVGFSIAGLPALMPAMVGGYLASNAGGGFLGGLVAGFIAGLVMLILERGLRWMPAVLDALKPILIYPVLGLLIVGALVLFISEPIAAVTLGLQGFLEGMSSANLILLGVILGGMMAVDLGGPVNKVAFTFGIAAIEGGSLAPHAAVMAGGMVPPLATAFATTLFRSKFTEEERKSGGVNYILGATFITEGAIPFAAANPLFVLPTFIFGSALAGGLSMLFKATLPAPHGGIFVIPLVHNPILYVVAIVGSSLITAVILAYVYGMGKKDTA